MTAEQRKFAYWQQQRQRQVAYRKFVGGFASKQPSPPAKINITFTEALGLDYYKCNGQIVDIREGVKVNPGSDVTIEVIAIEGFAFDKWSDASTDNPRTWQNVQSDLTVGAELKVTTAWVSLNQSTSEPSPETFRWKLYAKQLDQSFKPLSAVIDEHLTDSFILGQGLEINLGEVVKLSCSCGEGSQYSIRNNSLQCPWEIDSHDFSADRKTYSNVDNEEQAGYEVNAEVNITIDFDKD